MENSLMLPVGIEEFDEIRRGNFYYIDKADKTIRDEIDNSIDNIWSVLFTTGHLTSAEKSNRNLYLLKIPNEEVREVFRCQIQEWFQRTVQKDTAELEAFWQAFASGDVQTIEDSLTRI